MEYNELIYWNERENPTSCNGGYTQKHIEYIKCQLCGIKKLLDFGPGVGRTFSAYALVDRVEGCDISKKYTKRAIKESNKYNFKFHLTHLKDIKKIPFGNKEFEVVVSSEVLLHQKPENIIDIMKELLRISHKVIVISWMENKIKFDKPDIFVEDKTKYCFNYDYFNICKINNWKVLNIERYLKQIMFVYE